MSLVGHLKHSRIPLLLVVLLTMTASTAVAGVLDSDGDGVGNAEELVGPTDPMDADTDGDGLDDGAETANGTDPTAVDTDGDGLDDGAEVHEHGSDPLAADSDGDGLNDAREVEVGTDLLTADTDGEGLNDSVELAVGTDPTAADTDGDGVDDGRELDEGLAPDDADTDGDGLGDAEELRGPTDPTAADTDGDGLDDLAERENETDPTAADTDDDGLTDPEELSGETDPTDPDTDDDGVADGDDPIPTLQSHNPYEEARLEVEIAEPESGAEGSVEHAMDFWNERVHAERTPYEARLQWAAESDAGETVDVRVYFVDDVQQQCGTSSEGSVVGCAPLVEASDVPVRGVVPVYVESGLTSSDRDGVVTHEFGHAIGLGHDADFDVMGPYL